MTIIIVHSLSCASEAIFFLQNGPILASFFIFVFSSRHHVLGTRTLGGRKDGRRRQIHWAMAAPPPISEPILPNIFEQILAWRTYYETLSCCITISSNVSLCRLSNWSAWHLKNKRRRAWQHFFAVKICLNGYSIFDVTLWRHKQSHVTIC